MEATINTNVIAISFSFAAFFSAIISTKIYISFAKKFQIASKPHQGGVRKDIVPTSSGVAFGFVYILIIFIFDNFFEIPSSYTLSIIFGSGLMLLIGFLDDIYPLSSSFRLLFQFLFLFLIGYLFDAYILLYQQYGLIISFVLLFGSIWIINTFNFIDGADGLLSTNSAIFSIFGGAYIFLSGEITLAISLWILSCINIGFLFFNWSPAKVFMGDSGSLFLGSIFVIFLIGSIVSMKNVIWPLLILLSILYVETTVTLIVRLWRKENAFSEHHSLHAYQQEIIRTGIHSRPSIISLIISFFWTIPMSYLAFIFPNYGLLICLITCLPLSIAFYIFGPYQTKLKTD
tara:strand:- start:98 stop:1132 length:1035 start_codon:yes stop_codon:yes gene_type:complete